MAFLVTVSCAAGAAALTPVLVRLAEATAHRDTVAAIKVRLALVVVLGVVGAAAGSRLDVVHAVGLLPVVVLGGAAALVDAHERRLPDALTGCLTAVVAVTITLAAVGGNNDGRRAMYGFVTGLVLAVTGKWLSDRAVGWGDVKLTPSLAACLAWSSWWTVYLGLLTWAVLILVTAGLLTVRSGRAVVVPYGPAMVAGTLNAVLVTG